MGTDSLFWGPFRILYAKDDKLVPGQVFAVDGSVLLYSVSRRGLGFDTFALDPHADDAVEKLAAEWVTRFCACEEMMSLARSNVEKSRIRIFFESRPCKSRHTRLSQSRGRTINRALKSMLKIQSPTYRQKAEINAKKNILGVW